LGADGCELGNLIGRRTLIGGKGSFVSHWAFTAAEDERYFQLFVFASYSRSDRLRINNDIVEIKPVVTDKCSPGDIESHRILNEARFQALVQKERYITWDNLSSVPRFHIAAKGEPLCVDRRDLEDYFGITTVTSNQQDWLARS
jgi:hypothetical protein